MKVSKLRIAPDVYLVGDGETRISHQLDCHVYLIDCGERYVLIDSGGGIDTAKIFQNILDDNLDISKLKMLIVTHAHSDHMGGAAFIKEHTGCEVLATKEEGEIIENGSANFDEALRLCKNAGMYPPDYHVKRCKVDKILEHGDRFEIGKTRLDILKIPGHSEGICCVLMIQDNQKSFFPSDVVYINGTVGIGNWPGCDIAIYRNNIKKLRGLGADALFPGHYLWTLKGAQEHLDKAVDNFDRGYIPPTFGFNHPLY